MSKFRSKHNALRHGVFADSVLLPGESKRQFNALVAALIEEHEPSCILEYEAVVGIAACLWRKARLQAFRQLEATLDAAGDTTGSSTGSASDEAETDASDADDPFAVPKHVRAIFQEAMRGMDTISAIYDRFSQDTFESDLNLIERLDARIDRLLKRLYHLKHMRRMALLDKERAPPAQSTQAYAELPAPGS